MELSSLGKCPNPSQPIFMPNESILQVRDLTYRYGNRVAVDSIDFDIPRGGVFGLLGPNGAGKTTSIACIAGLLADWSGEMTFAGEPFQPAQRVGDRARVGWVPQELALYDELTARENIEFFASLAGLRGAPLRDATDRSLDLAGLTDRAGDRVGTFSGGMKRRLNLCIGQVDSPPLLLLDEPTVGVDPQSRSHLFETLSKITEHETTILYTTHYMEEAQRLCDQIAIMNEGKVIAVGTAAELASAVGQPDADLETVFLHHTGRALRDD